MEVQVHLVHAFTDGEQGGNPAGVVLDADRLAPEQKLAVARAVGLSETAFVGRSESADVRLEFFTPARQIAHCGHATVASFALLHGLGRIGEGLASKETVDGRREIVLRDGQAFMEQMAPRYRDLPLDSELGRAALAAVGLEPGQLLAGRGPCVVHTGNAFLLLPLTDAAVLAGLRPDQEAISRLSETLDLIGFYPFALQAQAPGRAAAARMFAPRYGIPEEAATGMAAGPLACYLHDVLGRGASHYAIEQGRLMPEPSPSLLQVELALADGRITRLMAGGRARVAGTMMVAV